MTPDVGRGPGSPFVGGNSHREDSARARSCQGLAAPTGRNTQVRAGVSFPLFKKIIWGCGVKRAHLSWLRGEHSFQKDSLGQEQVGRAGVQGGAAPSSTCGQSAPSRAEWGGAQYVQGGGQTMPSDPMGQWARDHCGDPQHCPSQADGLSPEPSAAGGGACPERPGAGVGPGWKASLQGLEGGKPPMAPIPWGSGLYPGG